MAVSLISPQDDVHKEMYLMFQAGHVPPLPVDTVALALRGQEDIMVVRVADRGYQGKVVYTLKSFCFVFLVIFLVHPYCVKKVTILFKDSA